MALRNLHYFIAAAKEQHFGRAAELIGISQPAMSRQIRDLEAEIGVALFDRRSRGVQLSTAGQMFLDHAIQITLAYERACEHAKRADRGETGRLRVGFNDFSISYEHVPRFFKQFRSAYPGIRLDLIAMSSIKQLEALNGGGLDSGFVYFYEVREQFNHLVLGREDLLLAVHATHPLARKPAVRIKDLAAEPFIGIRRDVMPDYHDRVIAACRRKGLTPRIVQETHNELTVLQLVSVEMGIGFVRSSLASRLPKNVRLRPVPGISMDIRFGMVWPKDDASPALQHFVTQVRALTA